jgi:phosphonatase-like hydrolase
MTIKLAILDIAGTTVRDEDGVNRCLRAALHGVGVAVSNSEVNRVMGIPKPIAIRMLLEQHRGAPPLADEIDTLHADFLKRMISFYDTDPAVAPTDGSLEAFGQLRRAGIKVALDTGFSRATVDTILRRLNWRPGHTIDFTVASDEVPQGRPHPDLVHAAMRMAGVSDPGLVAKIGDTPADLLEGHAAGCKFNIGVTNGTHTQEELATCPHTHLIDSLRELPPLLLNSDASGPGSV